GGDYSFDAQIGRLWKVVETLGLGDFALIGHSLGGDLATLMTARDTRRRIHHLVNIEGNLTPDDLIISRRAVEADGRGEVLQWLREEFMERQVRGDWGRDWPSCRRSYESLQQCRPEAFCANAYELVRWGQEAPGREECKIGAEFESIDTPPKLYCWGQVKHSE